MVARDKDRLSLELVPSELIFSRDAANQIEAFEAVSLSNQVPRRFELIAEITPTADQLALYQGTYYSDELMTHYDVLLGDEKLILRHQRHGDDTLQPTMVDGFKIGHYDVKFERNEAQEISGFRVHTARVRGIMFHKVASASPLN